MELAPGGFLIVFASGKNERDPAEELHTDFALAAGGESVALVGPDEMIVHAYPDYPPQFADISYGMSSPEANLQTQTILVAEGADARAMIPTNGSLGSAWTLVGFDDASWLRGTTGVGFDYPGFVGLDVTAMRGVNTSVYIRIPFNVEDDAPVTRLTLRMKYEDGFVAYLNGHEVARANAPAGTEPAWNASATTNRPGCEAVEFADFDIRRRPTDSLGDNVPGPSCPQHGAYRSISWPCPNWLPFAFAVRPTSSRAISATDAGGATRSPGPDRPAIRDVGENPPPRSGRTW